MKKKEKEKKNERKERVEEKEEEREGGKKEEEEGEEEKEEEEKGGGRLRFNYTLEADFFFLHRPSWPLMTLFPSGPTRARDVSGVVS